MDQDVLDERADYDHRRRQLTKRLLAHEVRTKLIYRLTGYSRHRQAALCGRLKVPSRHRRRGQSPHSFTTFFRSRLKRSESSCAAVFCEFYDVIPAAQQQMIRDSFADLDWAERLCETCEAFRACFPLTKLKFEHFCVLALALGQRQSMKLGRCECCDCVILIDLLARPQNKCTQCAPRRVRKTKKTA